MADFKALLSGLRQAEAHFEKQLEGVRAALSSLELDLLQVIASVIEPRPHAESGATCQQKPGRRFLRRRKPVGRSRRVQRRNKVSISWAGSTMDGRHDT